MPIFTSKFSPNRSLIGNFLASVARKKDEVKSEQEKARTDSAQPSQDRLELTGQVSAAQQALANSPSAARLQTSATPHIPPQPPASAPPPREAQQAELQGNLKTIATGLQADAVEENRRNAQQAAQTNEASSRRDQQRALRDNQGEIQALQSERRRMEQEAQRADQSIRQLQSENARLRNRASNMGTTLDLLAV